MEIKTEIFQINLDVVKFAGHENQVMNKLRRKSLPRGKYILQRFAKSYT